MTLLNTLLQDMNKLETELSRFEIEFGVKSANFHAAMINGELDEFDALDEYRMEFIGWLALYETWQCLDQKYSQVIARQPIALQIKANLEPVYA